MKMRENKRFNSLWIGAATAVVVGCGTTPPPKQLVDARATMTAAKQGPAKDYAPAQLDTAAQALARAESAFEDDPSSQVVVDLAYIADRKARLAQAEAQIEAATQLREAAEEDYKEMSVEELEAAKKALKSGQAELEAEREARKEAERIAAAALKSLEQVAAVKAEERGVVITLSGAVLFASGKSELLPIAKEKLNQVVKTLKDEGNPPLRIEGHTDSTGSAQANRDLSLERANAVKEHLVSQGYPADKIATVGKGPDVPVASNSTTEGRANNRRVEIIVNPTN